MAPVSYSVREHNGSFEVVAHTEGRSGVVACCPSKPDADAEVRRRIKEVRQ